jgi:uncharacterized membrane protein YgcG
MKKILLLIALMAAPLSLFSQRAITGVVLEKDSREAAVQATVSLLKTDSSLVANAFTNAEGRFSLTAPADGNYLLRVSYVGFKPLLRQLKVSEAKPVALGTLSVEPDAIMLKETTITGHMAKVTVKEDTFVYNAGAYRTPEGSVVEELVRKLPGAQVSDDGKITINGKEVKKIMVDGKEFMTGDTKTALKNLPTSIVEKVKAYDEKSDLARVSGIDDGNEQTVLDFGLKRGMNKGFFSNTDLAAGTEDRYAARVMAAKFNSKMRVMGFFNSNNTNDMGFPGGGGRFGGGRNGLSASKMVGVNFNYEKKDKLKFDGSVRWNHNDGDVLSKNSSENFVSTRQSFSNSINQNYTRGNSWNAQMRLEWMPDTMTNISFRPTFSYSSSDGLRNSQSATYADDPYLYTADPLSDAGIAYMRSLSDTLVVNKRRNASLTYSDSKSVGGTLQVNRKLNSTGRNVTLQVRGNYGENESKSMTSNSVSLFLRDSAYQTNRYNLTPQKNWNYSARLTYSEPIMKATYLQFSYQFQYRYTKSDRSTYDFSNPPYGFDFSGVAPGYRGWDSYLSQVGGDIDTYYNKSLSRFSSYKNYIQEIEAMLRVIRQAYNFNVGVTFMPQTTEFTQQYLALDTTVTRHVFNFTPTADFRWKISKVSQLRFNYRGETEQPSMTDLLDITDNSDPLNISKGNPGLKPSFTNRFRLFYNNANMEKRQQALWASLRFSTTSNNISNKITYDQETGGRTTKPENIDGRWSADGSFMFNTSLDSASYFNANTTTNIGYNNYVGFYSVDDKSDSQKNNTRELSIYERLAASYRNEWIEFELNGSFDYRHSTNKLVASSNLDVWQFSYGFNTNVTLPWGTRLATDLNMNSRRGYNDASLNTNELIWNAQISQGFLKGKPLTLSLQFYDILRQQSTVSRTINAMQRSDTEYNSITSYAMLHVIYRMNLFGSKEARQGLRRGGPEGDGPGFGGNRGNRGNRSRGGFGGGGFGGGRF